MNISIFTATHDARFLPEVYESIRHQHFHEWLVLLNNGATYSNSDARVKIVRDDSGMDWVGYLKRRACELATGDALLELDHDDCLFPDAMKEAHKAFENSRTGFVYSNAVHATGDLKPSERFSEAFGWQYRPTFFRGRALDECVSFAPAPSSVSLIWYAPNHFRAFRRDAYEKAGGYNPKMRVLDDLDLMCRMYCTTEFKHVDKPLYLYRIHGGNTWLKHNAEIQENVYRLHDQYIEQMASKWADDKGLRKLELGGRFVPAAGFETVDLKNCDIVADLNQHWPFEDSSVGVVRAYDIFEHLTDSLHTMKELFRVLAPGGYALIQVPSTDGRGAFQDPTHKTFWNENSFLYYIDRRWAKYIDTPVRFQAIRLLTTQRDAQGVCWTRAHLVKLAGEMRFCGEVRI